MKNSRRIKAINDRLNQLTVAVRLIQEEYLDLQIELERLELDNRPRAGFKIPANTKRITKKATTKTRLSDNEQKMGIDTAADTGSTASPGSAQIKTD